MAYVLWRERYERVVLAAVGSAQDPFALFDAAMATFEDNLTADPEASSDSAMDRRIAELLEEAA